MLQLFPAKWRRFAWAAVLIVFTTATLSSGRRYWLIPRLAASLLWSNENISQASYSPSSSPEKYLPPTPPRPVYKYATDRPLANRPFVSVTETFPMAAVAKSSTDLPSIPPLNSPPITHVAEVTPLFIGFTKNWPLLQQTLVSFLTAGWPSDDIYVVENTGVMDANQQGRLGLQNPFYLDYARLTKVFGVHVS